MEEKTIEKIKKLLNLGKKTCYAGEAEKAMALAMRLAARIGVNIEDVEEPEKPLISEHLVWKEKANFSPWERRLAHGIANALGCLLLIRCEFRQRFKIIGTEEDACIFDAMYPFILKQLQMLYKEYKKQNESTWAWNRESFYKKSWYYGASARIYERAEEIFRTNATQEEQQQYALVVADKLVTCRDYMTKSLPNVTRMRSRPLSGSQAAYGSGYSAAGRVSFAGNRIEG